MFFIADVTLLVHVTVLHKHWWRMSPSFSQSAD